MILLRRRPEDKAVPCCSPKFILLCFVVLIAVASVVFNAPKRFLLSGQIDWVLSSRPSASVVQPVVSNETWQPDSAVLQRLRNIENELDNANWTFYMYDDPLISQSTVYHVRKKAVWGRYRDEIEYDGKLFDLIAKSNLRRMNYTNVDIIVIPTPVGYCIASQTLKVNAAINALLANPIFTNTGGNRHLMISTPFVTFRSHTAPYIKALSKHYAALENVTVASSQDAALSKEACMHFKSFLERYEFYGLELKAEKCEDEKGYGAPPVRRFASIGLGHVSDDFPLVEPSMEKFLHSKYFILYRTRTIPFVNNSTIYRRLPIDNMDQNEFPLSIIGFDAPSRKVWVDEFTDSKFCLVLRGDSPNSHALLRSVRAGCLPIIISDTYPIYNPALLSSLDMDDFAFFIPEQSFLRDPKGELLKFASLSNQAIYEKIQGVRLAQRILLPDHPQSLMVPALIKEVLETNQPNYLAKALTRAKAILARNNITS